MLCALAALLSARGEVAAQETGPAAPQSAAASRFAGQYKIDVWKKLERQEIRHWFWLKPDGAFEAGADWPYHENTKFHGSWSLSGGRIVLLGKGEVWTNQGMWRTSFARSYVITEPDGVLTLTPVPEKNRYGLMGWPNAFVMAPGAGAAVRSDRR